MNTSQEEARLARIQKYKEDRRRQLIAKTATIFSSNVTDRRGRKANRSASEDTGKNTKSTSELNINISPTSVPVRTTRTSRLRAAATSSLDTNTKKSNRSSSDSTLIDDIKNKSNRNSKIIERDKLKTNKKQGIEENIKTSSTTFNDIGAIKTKPKHSIQTNLDKDKCHLVHSCKLNSKLVNTNGSQLEKNNNINVDKDSEDQSVAKLCKGIDNIKLPLINGIKNEETGELPKTTDSNKQKTTIETCEELHSKSFNSRKDYKKIIQNELSHNRDIVIETQPLNKIETVLNFSSPQNAVSESVVSNLPKNNDSGLLGAVCVRKVERFSELLSNLCSPNEADILFEDILADNGFEPIEPRTSSPAVVPPCRRASPSPYGLVTTKRTTPTSTPIVENSGTNIKNKNRRPIESSPRPKTETSLPSLKLSSKITSPPSINKESSNKSIVFSSSNHTGSNEKRKNSEVTNKPSLIPKKSPENNSAKKSLAPVKQTNDTPVKDHDINTKLDINKKVTSNNCTVIRNENIRNDRRHRAQKESESLSEKYHNSKRLTSLGNTSKDVKNLTKNSSNDHILTKNNNLASEPDLAGSKNTEDMSIIHQPVIQHSNSTRLSQEMDSLTALTKQTLDRVNKLSNNLGSNKIKLDTSEPSFDALFASTSNSNESNVDNNIALKSERLLQSRGVSERLKDIDAAAQRLIDFEKQNAMFSDLSNDISSQNRRHDNLSTSFNHTPVSILKRKSLHEESIVSNTPNQAVASPPVTFSPNVVEPRTSRGDRQRQGILKKRRSLDESQVSRRSCSPEVSFADDGSNDNSKPILKNRRSSLEDLVRNRSPDGHIHSILKRKLSREEFQSQEEASHGSPEPHSILKRKSNSSSSSSTSSSHVSIAQAVLLAAAGGAEIIDDDKEMVRPILKKKSFSEERPCTEVLQNDTPRPILKKKSIENDDYDFERPKKPILKSSKKLSGDDGQASSFDLSEDDRSSRRSSLLRSKASDHSGSECETTVKPILKQRGSSLTRERSQSPRPRLSFCADNDVVISGTNFSSDSNDLSEAGPSRFLNITSDVEQNSATNFPSAVLRRRDSRPKNNPRSKSLACDVNDELLAILNSRRLKVEENCDDSFLDLNRQVGVSSSVESKPFPSIAARIKNMEQALTQDARKESSSGRNKNRDRERYKTQPVTVEEMRSVTRSSLEPGQMNFQAFGPVSVGSFPTRPVEFSAAPPGTDLVFLTESEVVPYGAEFEKDSDSSPFEFNSFNEAVNARFVDEPNRSRKDSFGEATFLDFDSSRLPIVRRQSTLDEIEKEVDKVCEALDEDSRALEDDERHQAEADNWSLNVSCDSGVYNRASSRDSGPQSGEELGLIEPQDLKDNHTTNSSDWSPTNMERGLFQMDRQRKSTEVENCGQVDSDEEKLPSEGFIPGLIKSNSVVARASMWQQMQQQARGVPRPLIRHSRSKNKDGPPITERFKTQPIVWNDTETQLEDNNNKENNYSLNQSKSSANVLDRDEDAKLDEDDPAKMSLSEKMKMFNSKLTHKPPVSGLPKSKEDRRNKATRLRTMPVLASQVQEAMENNERFTKSMTQETETPKNMDFQRKMELFRSASAKNTSLEYIMRQNSKNLSLDLDDIPQPEKSERIVAPEIRGVLKPVPKIVLKPKVLTKGESSEGLKDEGIDSSSDEDSASTSVSSSDKSSPSSDSSEEINPTTVKPKRFQNRIKNNKLKNSKTDSDLTKLHEFPRKIQMPCANELKLRLEQVKQEHENIPVLGKLRRDSLKEEDNPRYKRFVKKLEEPVQLAKLRRPAEKLNQNELKEPILKISALNQEAKNKFFGLDSNMNKGKTIEELTAAVRKYIPPVSKCMSIQSIEPCGSGSDGESSGGREVRHINTRGRNRVGNGIQRSATQADMPQRGGTIAERLAALQEAGANNWRTKKCRISPDRQENKLNDMKTIELAKNRINESLNAGVDEKKKVQVDKTELAANILSDTRNKLETASQQWRTRVPQNDANLFTVAGRLERDKVTSTPPMTPPPVAAAVATPGTPAPNKFRSRKQPSSPTNGFANGPLRSASCAQVCGSAEPKPTAKHDRETFKRSHSVSETICGLDEEERSLGVEKSGCAVRVPRADDETFQAFYTRAFDIAEATEHAEVDLDLDAIDSGSRQLLTSEWSRRAKRDRRHAASGNPLRALAARTDLKDEYCPAPASGLKELLVRDAVVGNCGLAAEALAALATKEDFSNVSLKSAAMATPVQGTKSLMLIQVKGRRRVQSRLVEPVHSNINSGDCFVLVTPDQLFLYIGLYSNVIEKSRSNDIASHILNTKDLGCKNATTIITIDEQTKKYTNKHWNQFWSLLGVTENIEDYKPVEAGHADEDEIYESCMVQTNMCYEVLDDELVPIQEYWGQMPKIAMLQLNKTIVYDFGSELYIWYGKNVPLDHRRKAAQLAQELFDNGYNYEECHINPIDAASCQGNRDNQNSAKQSKKRPEWAIISKVTQHMETILFKEKFLDWPDYTRVIKIKEQDNKNNSIEIKPCDADEMFSNEYQEPDLVLEGSHLGRGTSYYDKETMRHFDIKTKSLTKWIIREFDYQKVENDKELGEFFTGDSYIFRWEYQITVSGRELNGKPSKHNVTGRDRCAYFNWQGRDASSNEKGAAALLTVELDKEKGPQVRVSQGNEPPAFLNLFQGNLVINQGKKDTDKNRYKLYITRGNLANEAYLLQVPCTVRQLRSRGSLVLVDNNKNLVYVWHGSRSLKHTKSVACELAKKFAERKLEFKVLDIKESEEPKEFLEALGSNKQLFNSVMGCDKESDSDFTPRLFHFTDLGGQFEAHEVLSPLRHETLVTPFPFEQRELYSASQPALFLLDSGTVLWLWMGWWPRAEGDTESDTNTGVGQARWQALRVAALRTASAYSGRAGRGDVRAVLAGLEPDTFTSLFPHWTLCDEPAEDNIQHGYKAGEILSGASELSRLTNCTAILPLAALQRRPLPDHVSPQHLERHLNEHDFVEAFGMTKEEFSVVPAWKQTNLKKDIGLF